MILKAKAFMEAEHGARVVYGDSVAPGTPVLARLADGRIAVAPVEALAAPGAAWREWRGGKEQTTDLIATEVWAAGAWAALLRLVRHRAGKPVVRVATAGGVADVTEDHSLVLEGGGALAKPSALRPGATRLQHVRPPQAALAPVAAGAPSGEALPGAASLPLLGWLNNPDAAAREGVLDAIFPGSGTCAFSSQTDAQAAYVLAASVGRTAEVLGARSLRLLPRGADPPPPPSPVVASCTPLPPAAADPAGEEAYVYDLETSSGVFQGGVGCLLLKNTDSIFCVFPNLDPATGARLRGRDALVASIATGQEASRRFRPLLKPPHDLEYEKTFFPFVLLSKKRYVGLLYEADPDKCKQVGVAPTTLCQPRGLAPRRCAARRHQHDRWSSPWRCAANRADREGSRNGQEWLSLSPLTSRSPPLPLRVVGGATPRRRAWASCSSAATTPRSSSACTAASSTSCCSSATCPSRRASSSARSGT